jgi:protein-tyrosine phosphatase
LQKVLFVCTANVCRSPIAQAIFNALAADKGLPFRAESAGTAALEGKPMAPNAVSVLEEVGIYPGAHRARQVSEAMIEEAALVLAMSPRHAATLRRLAGRSSSEIRTLPEYATGVPGQEGIPDPHGLTMAAHRSTLRQLHEYVESAVDRLGG